MLFVDLRVLRLPAHLLLQYGRVDGGLPRIVRITAFSIDGSVLCWLMFVY